MNSETIRRQIDEIKDQLRQNSGNPELYNDLGVGYYLLGKMEEAIEELNRAVSIDPENTSYKFNLANAYAEAEMFDPAKFLFHGVIDKKPDHIPSFNNLADCYEATGDDDKALDLFEYITKIAPDNALAHFNLGNFHLRKNRHIQAAKCYEKAIEIEDTFTDAYYNLSWILKQVKALDEAFTYTERGLLTDPEHEDLKQLASQIRDQIR